MTWNFAGLIAMAILFVIRSMPAGSSRGLRSNHNGRSDPPLEYDMNIDELTYGDLKRIAALFQSQQQQFAPIDNGMIGTFVIVRCRDAGVHAGVLESHNGRECILKASRRLWRWIPKQGAWLSGVANYGLSDESKIGSSIRVHLTETCEIIQCSKEAERSIREFPSYEP